jgi:hypothetical protein
MAHSIADVQASEVAREHHTQAHDLADDGRTSTFAADMLSSLPDKEKNVEIENVLNRSRYVAEHAVEQQQEPSAEKGDEEGEAPFFDIEQGQGHQLSANDKMNLFLEEFGSSGLEELLGDKEQYASITESVRCSLLGMTADVLPQLLSRWPMSRLTTWIK